VVFPVFSEESFELLRWELGRTFELVVTRGKLELSSWLGSFADR